LFTAPEAEAVEVAEALPTLEISAARNPQLAENIQNALSAGRPPLCSRTEETSRRTGQRRYATYRTSRD
jgi:hypothetical protein